MNELVRLEGVEKQYGTVVRTRALASTDLTLEGGHLVVILGPSGSGKTTLLNLIGGLDSPTRGRIEVAGQDLSSLDARALGHYRRDQVGFVFQFFNLIPSLTASENVALAAELVDNRSGVDALLEAVGLGAQGDHFPAELSGGQQQRVAIARALAKRPRILLADEPTGALDHETGRGIVQLLRGAADDRERLVIVVTHDESITAYADRVIRLRDGAIVNDDRC